MDSSSIGYSLRVVKRFRSFLVDFNRAPRLRISAPCASTKSGDHGLAVLASLGKLSERQTLRSPRDQSLGIRTLYHSHSKQPPDSLRLGLIGIPEYPLKI